MPSEFTGSPRILKGALAVYESQDAGTEPSLIMFQFNPDQMRRTLARRSAPPEPGNSGAARQDVMRVPGPPVESISLTITLDATDQLVAPDENPSVAENGLHPVLAKLEMLLYPPSLQVQELENLLEQGEVQISPQDLPMVLLVWGESRVVPVQLTNFTVTEEAYDQRLNPIRARVELGLKVLTYVELQQEGIGRDAFVAYQRQKENLAAEYQPGSGQDRTRGLLPQ
jgi:hypothetical protein